MVTHFCHWIFKVILKEQDLPSEHLSVSLDANYLGSPHGDPNDHGGVERDSVSMESNKTTQI